METNAKSTLHKKVNLFYTRFSEKTVSIYFQRLFWLQQRDLLIGFPTK